MTFNDRLKQGVPVEQLLEILRALPHGTIIKINRNLLMAIKEDGSHISLVDNIVANEN